MPKGAETLKDFSRAIALTPGQALYHKDRGLVTYFAGDAAAALPDLEQAISLDPGFAQAYFFRSKVWLDSGKIPEAVSDARKARELGFQLPEGFLDSLQ